MKIPANIFVQREITLMGSQGYCRDFQTALKMLEGGRIRLKDIVTHKLPLTSLQKAFDLLTEPGNRAIKVVLQNE